MATNLAFADYLQLRNLVFEWAESYDTKDWDRLRRIAAPSMRLDYRAFGGQVQDNLTPDDYVAHQQKAFGDKRMKTQHLIGAAKYELLDDGRVQAALQLRVAHQRYADESLKEVIDKGSASGISQHCYRKIDGVWKIEAVAPQVHFSEQDLPKSLGSEQDKS